MIDAHGADDAIAIAVQLSGGAPAEVHELSSIARRVLGGDYRKHVDDATLRRALLAGYPDRVAQRREAKSPRLLLSSGTGATLAREIDDGNGEFLVILDITGELVRNARVVEREWLSPTHREVVHEWDGHRVRAIERSWYGAILLHEQNVAPEPTRRSGFSRSTRNPIRCWRGGLHSRRSMSIGPPSSRPRSPANELSMMCTSNFRSRFDDASTSSRR